MSLDEFKNLKTLKIKKNKELYLSKCYFLISGKLELYIIDENENGIKIKNLTPDQYLVGMSNKQNLKGTSIYYKALSDSVLVELNSELLNKLFNNPIFLNWYTEILFNTLIEISKDLIARSTLEKERLIKYYLIKESCGLDHVVIPNNLYFIRKYKINRSTFYSNIKKLENSGEIIKIGDTYKILK